MIAARVLMFLIGGAALAGGVAGVLPLLAMGSALGGVAGGPASGLSVGLRAGFGALAVAEGVLALAVGGYWVWAGVAVGRASRFARALSTVFLAITLAALLGLLVLVPATGASTGTGDTPSVGTAVGGVVAVVALVALAVAATVLVLLWVPTSTRAFFARPLPCRVCEEPAVPAAEFCGQCGHQLPPRVPTPIVAVQVLLALNAISEVGVVLLGAGSAVLMGAIGPSVVADEIAGAGTVSALGTASAVVAILAAVTIVVDLWAIPAVASGRPAARLTVSVVFVLGLLVDLVALSAQDTSGPQLVAALVVGGLLPATLIILLWAPSSSRRHFAPRSPAATPAAVSVPAPRPYSALPPDEPLTTPLDLGALRSRTSPPSGRHAAR